MTRRDWTLAVVDQRLRGGQTGVVEAQEPSRKE
jgi:hypothetical protein